MKPPFKDADRYIWLLAHMGLVEEEARLWNPHRDKPLLIYLQDFIDMRLSMESATWVKRQREILNQ